MDREGETTLGTESDHDRAHHSCSIDYEQLAAAMEYVVRRKEIKVKLTDSVTAGFGIGAGITAWLLTAGWLLYEYVL